MSFLFEFMSDCSLLVHGQASMTVCDILEMQGGAGQQPLGSVVFSEAFMDSRINIQHRGE